MHDLQENEEQPAGAGDRAGTTDREARGNGGGTDGRLVHFIRLLSDDNEGTRWKAAESLGRIGDPAAVDALIETLWDDDERVRLKAAWALGEIGDDRAVPALRRLYRMETDNIKEIIAEALNAIGRQAGGG